jgi:ESCRT-II complex subunit VPS36
MFPYNTPQACKLWEKLRLPLILEKFESGVLVVKSRSHSDQEVCAATQHV